MPRKRKTREEKIIAELRRKLESQQMTSNVETVALPMRIKPQTDAALPKPAFNINTAPNHAQTSTLNYDYSYVKKDLLKTILLTTVATSAFIVLYWGMEIRG